MTPERMRELQAISSDVDMWSAVTYAEARHLLRIAKAAQAFLDRGVGIFGMTICEIAGCDSFSPEIRDLARALGGES